MVNLAEPSNTPHVRSNRHTHTHMLSLHYGNLRREAGEAGEAGEVGETEAEMNRYTHHVAQY